MGNEKYDPSPLFLAALSVAAVVLLLWAVAEILLHAVGSAT